jgi:hypothetical protein
VVATADNATSSLRSGRLNPAVPHFKRSALNEDTYPSILKGRVDFWCNIMHFRLSVDNPCAIV